MEKVAVAKGAGKEWWYIVVVRYGNVMGSRGSDSLL